MSNLFDDRSSNESKELFVNIFHVFLRWRCSFVQVMFSGIRVSQVKPCDLRWLVPFDW